MKTVQSTVYYVEMLTPPDRPPTPVQPDVTVIYQPSPTYEYYREIYDKVGEDYNWRSRRRMSREALLAIIQDPRDEMHVLHVNGQPAGFAELDRRQPNEIELVQFGLIPEFCGQGLGRWFINWTIDKAFSYQPKRFWLHTCSLDHPGALPNYLKAGFRQYKQEVIEQAIG